MSDSITPDELAEAKEAVDILASAVEAAIAEIARLRARMQTAKACLFSCDHRDGDVCLSCYLTARAYLDSIFPVEANPPPQYIRDLADERSALIEKVNNLSLALASQTGAK